MVKIDKNMYEKLGKHLRQAREQKGYSLEFVAERIGVTKKTVQRYELGESRISNEKLRQLTEVVGLDKDVLINSVFFRMMTPDETVTRGVKIPVLGLVPAGIPIEAIEDIIDYEEITQEMASTGEFFALQIKGDSMAPRILDGDVVIVRKQENIDSGDIAIVMVNGFDATCKKVLIKENGIMLQPMNQEYEASFYSPKEIGDLPVHIIGKVIELRGKF